MIPYFSHLALVWLSELATPILEGGRLMLMEGGWVGFAVPIYIFACHQFNKYEGRRQAWNFYVWLAISEKAERDTRVLG